jgi:nucleoside-diphosphate-sugar epimerase
MHQDHSDHWNALTMAHRALIAGVSGIVGRHLAEHLNEIGGWEVVGLSRHPHDLPPGVRHIAGDLTNGPALKPALAGVGATHVFITTWSRQATEAENIKVNGAMVANLLDALADQKPQHVALVTGLKHYLGPFEAYAKAKPITPFREEQARLPYENFYYEQEDVVFDRAKKRGFTWTVHRPHTLIGYAVGNAMNMAATLGAYAAICKESGKPFVFPGSPEQFAACVDITDGRVLAKQLAWAATTPAAANQALNITNGEIFRWNWMWPKLAANLGVAAAAYPGTSTPLAESMAGMEPVWDAIVVAKGLQKNALNTVASWWHSDADLGRTIENFTDMTKARDLGFLAYQNSIHSFTDAFDRLRANKIIP